MTAILNDHPLDFVLDDEHEAHEPAEARGLPRDGVRLLVSPGLAEPIDARFSEIGTFLSPGDLVVVNTSATIPGALDGRLPDGEPVVVHVSGSLPGDVSLVEVRRPHDGSTTPLQLERPERVELLTDGYVDLLAPFADSKRLWLAKLQIPQPVTDYLIEHGRPIRYRHVPRDWPLESYQTIFAREPGSVEMPSASRPFTPEVVTDLVGRGVLITPLVLHTGVSSLEGSERPYPERYRVTRDTASLINAVRHEGGRVVAAGTTVVRALATVTDDHGVVHPGQGWTDIVVTPRRAAGRGRRPAHRLARARIVTPHDARGIRRPRHPLPRVPPRPLARVPVARVRRQPPHPAPARSTMTPKRPAATPTLPAGRRAVLYALRRRGEATAEQVADQLGMTVSGARQHLTALTRAGLVEAAEMPSTELKRGRRTLAYSATAEADQYFPKAYGELTNELLGYVADSNPELLEDLFAKRRQHRIDNAQTRLAGKRTLGAKVAELTRILDEDGYLATYEKVTPGVYRVIEHNCAIWAVAQRYGQACTSEIDFIRAALPEAEIERVQHMVAGARHCAYEIRDRARAESA